jgi:hypothetical protein
LRERSARGSGYGGKRDKITGTNCMLNDSSLKPYVVTKKEAQRLLPPRVVDRLIYAALNFPELGWLELLPSPHGRKRRDTYIVLTSLEKAFERIRAGGHPPDFPSEIKLQAVRAMKRKAAKEPDRF